jgi:8-oxo-dGTP pyrophosphatase MutT (NUDIX family)
MVGGHVEPGESPAGSRRRGLSEELGIALRVVPPVWNVASDQKLGIELSIYRIYHWHGMISNAALDEHAELRWFRESELGGLPFPHPLYPSMLASSFAER